MTVLELLEEIEDIVDTAPGLPLTGKIMIDSNELLEIVREIRLSLPDDVQQAKWVKEERQRILSEAETRAQTMVKNAEDKVRQMIDENEVTRQAVEQANQLVNDAQTRSMEIKMDCDQYADDVLADVEKRLNMLLNKVHDDRVYFNNKQ